MGAIHGNSRAAQCGCLLKPAVGCCGHIPPRIHTREELSALPSTHHELVALHECPKHIDMIISPLYLIPKLHKICARRKRLQGTAKATPKSCLKELLRTLPTTINLLSRGIFGHIHRRSVYSSTISVFDVEDTDLSKFENLVHKTNSYLFEPSGRQWKFFKGTQHRSHGTKNQTTETPNRIEDGCQVFHSKDFLRPQLQQTKGNITEIRRHYMMKGGVNIIPVSLTSHVVDIKDMLLSLFETEKSLFRCNLVTGAELDLSDDEKCLVHLTESLATTLDFPVSERPSEISCDMFLAFPKQPPVVLTVMNREHESKMIQNYNTSVAKGVTSKLRRFTNENLNVIHGVVSKNDMKDNEVFLAKLQQIAAVSSVFISKTSLMMNSFKYDQILMAFWAALAETKVDVQESQLKFLNKEQCILLLENLHKMNVEVRLNSSSEATTLMLEVARRLSRQGNTLLICRILEERDRLRSVYSSTISLNDVWKWDLSAYENIVLDARSLPEMPNGCRVWRFQTNPASVEEPKMLFQTTKKEVHEMEKQLSGLHNASEPTKQLIEEKPKGFLRKTWASLRKKVTGIKKRKKYSEQKPKQPLMDSGPHASRVDYPSVTPSMVSLMDSVSDTSLEDVEYLSSQDSLEDLSKGAGSQITTLEETHECFEDVEKLTEDLDIVGKPLMDSVPHASRVDYPSVTSSVDSLKDPVSGILLEDVESLSSQDSLEDLSLLGSSKRADSQITTLEETHECFEDVEKLTEDLDIVEKEKDNTIMQLSPLYTAEWQNTLGYLSRNTGSLSRFIEQQSRLHTTDSERHDHPIFEDSSEIPTDFPDGATRGRHLSNKCRGTDFQRKQKQTGHVLQMRQFQEGRLGRTPLYAILERMIAEDKAAIAHHEGIILSMKQGDRLVYVIETPVLCSKLHLDAARANTRWCHVTTDDQLVNTPPLTWLGQERHRLQRYSGTCSSTPIPLHPPHSALTPVYRTPRYWETLAKLRVVGERLWCPVLEMGVSEAGQVDRGYWVSDQRRSWCVCVESCVRHPGSVCTRVYREGKQGECQQNTMSRAPGTQATLHYGVVLDVARGRLAFIDLNREIVLAKFDEMFKEDLYPMFGVPLDPEKSTTNMKLVSGEDINITDTKKSLIHHALT